MNASPNGIGAAPAAHCPCCGKDVDPHAVLLDPSHFTVSYDGRTAQLSHMEFLTVQELVRAYPAALSKDRLYDNLYASRAADGDMPEPKIIDVQICHARKKLAGVGVIITTTWGFGYGLTLADPALADALKEAGIRARAPGARRHWRDDDDRVLVDLLKRGFRLQQIASMMKAPYLAIQRAMERLELDSDSRRRAA